MRYRMTIEFDIENPNQNANPDKALLHLLLSGQTLETCAALSIDNGSQIHIVKNRNGRCGKYVSAQHACPFDIVDLTDGSIG
jgi:hypothetical protein